MRPPDIEIKAAITNAWLEYLDAVRFAVPERYDEVEIWAWTRLQVRLEQLREFATSPATAK
jgi:hypothetical protein